MSYFGKKVLKIVKKLPSENKDSLYLHLTLPSNWTRRRREDGHVPDGYDSYTSATIP